MKLQKHLITGAFGYSGKYIAHLLQKKGFFAGTITNTKPASDNNNIQVHPLNFQDFEALVNTMKQYDVLYNTYWVRFNHKTFTHHEAVENTKIMFQAAKKAGIKKIVHVSITNPDINSDLEYFQGKGELEKDLINSGIPYSILRPTVIFGKEDILINNIAYFVRRLPIIGIFGKGEYRLQPIFVEDLAELAVQEGQSPKNKIINAIGSETYTYKELIQMLANVFHKNPAIWNLHPRLGYHIMNFLGKFYGDVIITKPEIKGLMSDLLFVDAQPVGRTKLSEWVKNNRHDLGQVYHSELARRK